TRKRSCASKKMKELPCACSSVFREKKATLKTEENEAAWITLLKFISACAMHEKILAKSSLR
ncbi:CD99 isoform 12, partial [Pongo abelii]